MLRSTAPLRGWCAHKHTRSQNVLHFEISLGQITVGRRVTQEAALHSCLPTASWTASDRRSYSQAGDTTDALASTGSEAAAGPVQAAMQAIDGLHSLTGLPWWAVMVVSAVGAACNASLYQPYICNKKFEYFPVQECGLRCFLCLYNSSGRPAPCSLF